MIRVQTYKSCVYFLNLREKQVSKTWCYSIYMY